MTPPTQSTLEINILTTPMSTLSFAPTFTAPVLPGGGGGGGGGGPPVVPSVPAPGPRAPGGGGAGGAGGGGGPPAVPPAAPAAGAAANPPNDKLGGNPPQEFTGDREKSQRFILEFQLYQGMNVMIDLLLLVVGHWDSQG